MRDAVHPAGLVGDVDALREPGRHLVPVLLRGQHRLDRRARLRARQGAGCHTTDHPREVRGGDQVVEAVLTRRRVPDPAGQHGRGGAARVPQHGRHLRRTDVLEQQVGGQVAGLHHRVPGQRAQVDLGAQPVPGPVVLVVVLVQREDAAVVGGPVLVVHRHRPVEVEGAPLGEPVGRDQQRELHGAGGVVPGVGLALEPGRPTGLAGPDRDPGASREPCLDQRAHAVGQVRDERGGHGVTLAGAASAGGG